MSFLLPPTIALKSSQFNYYLNYSNDSDSENHGFLKFNGANVFSSLAKFQVVTANTGTGLVHIRCCHNKKFLRMRTEGDVHLSPEADEPEEDQSKWSCTLFEPRLAADGNPDKARLFHVQSKKYATAWDEGGKKFSRLHADQIDQGTFEIIDLESLVILPKHVAFKAGNNLYLRHADSNQLRFMSTDKGVPESWFEVSTDGDGRVKIKVFNSLSNNYLRFSDATYGNCVFADGNSNGCPPPTLFWPVKVDNSTVALKCLSNDKFCTRHTGYIQDGLNVNETSTTISNLSRFRLEELVLSRRIYNTDFDLKNAIIYGETPVTMATANATNNTSVANTVEFKFAYTESKSCMWSASHSWMVGVSATVDFKVPFIGGTEVTVSAEYSGSYEWGETITSENTLETTYTVTVPAHTSISVSLMATKGKCDVPYSYYQRDVLYNGKTVVYKKDDGLYTGVNSYNFRYVVTTQKEPDSTAADSSPSEQWLPDPSIFPSKQQKIPLPVPFGSTTMQSPVTSTTAPKKELSMKIQQLDLP
ncbi:putative aerolysin, Agglutinin domain, aerolysin-like toxin, beta complex domain-containing protein [Rosa chinensis]|uniref:Putative aerolysin, Agglutinin domain, aerolysin-like toxin, beta complex domain-containing protein n=1 Tax=Rosa chinensis TaxID=74649 RepID=A0A2P6S3C0_ROSCH|nr:uncharacterized protein LOC121051344 [Rosa chinensis]PRQ53180.1 putative aerolysin, Agglutinin domain, aerolysin-like toxin, beta complex domain-containing protein [Rosa chinensis]